MSLPSALLTGTITARLYRLHDAPPRPLIHAFQDAQIERDRKQQVEVDFVCENDTSNLQLDEDRFEDDETPSWSFEQGLARGWIRLTKRKAPGSAVTAEARRLALTRHHRPLARLDTELKLELRGEAKRNLVDRAVPSESFHPFLVWERHLLLVGQRAPGDPLQGRLRQALGPLEQVPLLWDTPGSGSFGWSTLQVLLLKLLSEKGPQLSPTLNVTELRAETNGIRIALSGLDQLDAAKAQLSHLLTQCAEGSTLQLKRLIATVKHEGDLVEIAMDQHGLARLRPGRSRGGLLHERLLRRMTQGLEAAQLLRAHLERELDRTGESEEAA